jgi:iron(II)-dependent oxidoreductase
LNPILMKHIIISASIISLMPVFIQAQEPSETPVYPGPVIQQEMALIQTGTFIMGVKSDPGSGYIDNVDHVVRVGDFYIDKYEVTNYQYHQFVQETGHRMPEFWGMDEFRCGLKYPDHPVVGVTWVDALEYAEWAGKRLLTEAEWEYAARGGLVQKRFPDGDEMGPDEANYNGTNGHPVAVGSFPANGYGLHDMAGNVTEWVQDYYDKDYYLESPAEDPGGPEIGKRRVIRGGGWRSGKMCNACNFRQSLRPYWVDIAVGFRCARDLKD